MGIGFVLLFWGVVGLIAAAIEGKLPRRALGLVLDWAELHRQELRDNWVRGQEHDALSPIAPQE